MFNCCSSFPLILSHTTHDHNKCNYMKLKKRVHNKLHTASPDFSTKVIVVVLFVCIMTTIIVVRIMHRAHEKDQPHD